MDNRRYSSLIFIILLFSIWGCSTLPSKEVHLCENRQCDTIKSPSQRQEVLGKLYTLLKNNLNRDIDFYRSTPDSREQSKKGFGFYLQGGPMPGWAVVRSIKFTDILYVDRENFEIKFKVDPDVIWNGMPCFSTSTEGTLSVKENNQIQYSTTYFISWMVVGTSVWKHDMVFDYIDFDNSLMGSFYSIGGGGPLCAGKGSGYALVKFPVDSRPQPESMIAKIPTVEPAIPAGGNPSKQSAVPAEKIARTDPANRPAPKDSREETRETVEVISQLPKLGFTTSLWDQNNNRILDGGEEIVLKIDVRNTGSGVAKDVQVALSGHRELIGCLGEKKALGEIRPGEQKTAEFRAILPAQIPPETASLRIEILEGSGFSPSLRKTLQIAMRPAEITETVEVISEVDVDDIPAKIKGYERKDAVALFIGIGKYREEKVPPVKYAARDAQVMAKYFENLGGIPKTNIQVLTDDKASKSDIQAYIEDWLPRRVNENSTVFVYYSGHGAPDVKGKEAYIVPYEGQPDFPSQLYPLRNLYDSLGRLPAKEVVVLLDSCFSGTKGRSVMSEGARPLVMTTDRILPANHKVRVFAGAAGDQIGSDYDRARHGLFTYYLLRGLRGEADEKKQGVVMLGELYRYVKTHVSEKASLELNRDQTPVLLPSEPEAQDRLEISVVRTR